MNGHFRWDGLVIPYGRRTKDGRLFTSETKFTYRSLPIPVIERRTVRDSATAGFCNRVIVDSTVGVSVGLWLDLANIRFPGVFWAQADLGPDFEVGAGQGLRAAELVGFHLGTTPAWTNMTPIVVTEEMLEEART